MWIKVKTKLILLDYGYTKHNFLDSNTEYLTDMPNKNITTICLNYPYYHYKFDKTSRRYDYRSFIVYLICG